jgi:adiponectin receptor
MMAGIDLEKDGYVGTWLECPEELRDNEYIIYGYRINYRGWLGKNGVLSTFALWHNETVNVWSHFIGLLIFFLITCFLIFY